MVMTSIADMLVNYYLWQLGHPIGFIFVATWGNLLFSCVLFLVWSTNSWEKHRLSWLCKCSIFLFHSLHLFLARQVRFVWGYLPNKSLPLVWNGRMWEHCVNFYAPMLCFVSKPCQLACQLACSRRYWQLECLWFVPGGLRGLTFIKSECFCNMGRIWKRNYNKPDASSYIDTVHWLLACYGVCFPLIYSLVPISSSNVINIILFFKMQCSCCRC